MLDAWPVTQERNECQGLYDVDVTLSKPKAGIEWRKGVAKDREHGTKRVRAISAKDAVNIVADAMAEKFPRHDVLARYSMHGHMFRAFRKHSK